MAKSRREKAHPGLWFQYIPLLHWLRSLCFLFAPNIRSGPDWFPCFPLFFSWHLAEHLHVFCTLIPTCSHMGFVGHRLPDPAFSWDFCLGRKRICSEYPPQHHFLYQIPDVATSLWAKSFPSPFPFRYH